MQALFGNLYVIIPLTPSKISWGIFSLLVVDHAPFTIMVNPRTMDEDAVVICKRFIDFQLLGKNWRHVWALLQSLVADASRFQLPYGCG